MAAAKLHPLNHLVNFVCTRYSVMNCDKCEGSQPLSLKAWSLKAEGVEPIG